MHDSFAFACLSVQAQEVRLDESEDGKGHVFMDPSTDRSLRLKETYEEEEREIQKKQ